MKYYYVIMIIKFSNCFALSIENPDIFCERNINSDTCCQSVYRNIQKLSFDQ